MTAEKTPFIPQFVKVLGRLYITGLGLFTFLRLLLFYYSRPQGLQLLNSTSIKAFQIGLQFDSVILAYILAIPLLLLFTQSMLATKTKFIPLTTAIILLIVAPATLIIAVSDIPYYDFFNDRLTESAFQWMNTPGTVFKMLIGDLAHVAFLCLGLFGSVFMVIALFRYCRKELIQYDWTQGRSLVSRLKSTAFFLLLGFVCFLGLRGRIASPIRTGDAFYCTNPFLNQLGLNPAFTLMKSMAEKVSLMDEALALKNTQELLGINQPLPASPIARMVPGSDQPHRYNVVLVLMESMSANYMGTFGNPEGLTPNLDSLVQQSWFFPNCYSAGIHTSNGIFASLYSFPALKRIRPMSAVPARQFSGLPYTLQQHGYHNLFFSTHGFSFDNLGTFIPHNFFNELYTAENYPSDKIIGPFGVPDDFVFQFAIDKLNQRKGDQPFLATILTTSNHDPYILPPYYKATKKDKASNGVAYADWSIGQFLEKAKTAPWFDSTIFVFVSDHGLKVGDSSYDLALSYNHIPLFFYAPKILGKAHRYEQFIGQIDIFPSLMHLLNQPYINNTLGQNTFTAPRNCMYFSADSKIGCINKDWLYVYRFGGEESLYHYPTGSEVNHNKERPDILQQLRQSALSNIQTAEYIISRDFTSLKGK